MSDLHAEMHAFVAEEGDESPAPDAVEDVQAPESEAPEGQESKPTEGEPTETDAREEGEESEEEAEQAKPEEPKEGRSARKKSKLVAKLEEREAANAELAQRLAQAEELIRRLSEERDTERTGRDRLVQAAHEAGIEVDPKDVELERLRREVAYREQQERQVKEAQARQQDERVKEMARGMIQEAKQLCEGTDIDFREVLIENQTRHELGTPLPMSEIVARRRRPVGESAARQLAANNTAPAVPNGANGLSTKVDYPFSSEGMRAYLDALEKG